MKLIFHLPEGKVEEFTVDKTTVSIGRGNVCDVVLPFEGFSRRHAQVELVDGEIFVTDLGSTNGVYIDGQRITPAERTQMQSFLSLQIGPAQQVEILDDTAVEAPVRSPVRESTRSHAPKKMEAAEHTKTTQMDPRLLKRPGKKTQEKEKDGQNKAAMILLPLLVLGGAVYYFVMMGGEEAQEAPQVTEEVVAPVVPLTETEFLSVAIYESLKANKSCAADKAVWCRESGVLETNKEGVVIEGKNVIVYMNMTSYRDEKFHDGFNTQDEQKRLEILALRRVFNSGVLRNFTRQTALDTLQVVLGVMDQNELKLRLALKFKRDLDMKKADKFAMYDLFDRILNEGKVEDLPEITNLFDKISLE